MPSQLEAYSSTVVRENLMTTSLRYPPRRLGSRLSDIFMKSTSPFAVKVRRLTTPGLPKHLASESQDWRF